MNKRSRESRCNHDLSVISRYAIPPIRQITLDKEHTVDISSKTKPTEICREIAERDLYLPPIDIA